MIWINGIACLTSIFAGIGAWKMLARRRALPPSAGRAGLVAWQQPLLAGHRSSARQMAEMLPHGMAQVIIAFLLIASINRGASSPTLLTYEGPSARWLAQTLGYRSFELNLISWVAAAFAAALAGMTVGALLGFVLVVVFGPMVSISVGSEGVRFGALLFPWDNVVGVRLFPAQRELLVFAGDPPNSYPLALAPPTQALYEKAEGAVGDLLSARSPGSATLPRSQGRAPSRLLFGLITIIAVIVGLTISRVNAEWVWLLYGVELAVLSQLGARFYRGRSPSM